MNTGFLRDHTSKMNMVDELTPPTHMHTHTGEDTHTRTRVHTKCIPYPICTPHTNTKRYSFKRGFIVSVATMKAA